MKQQSFVSLTDAKYRNARISLLTVFICSALNLILLGISDIYFLFSAYLPLLTVAVGSAFYAETGLIAFYIIALVIGMIMVIPYLLCWIFSKKKVGWMIGALVLASIDSLLFLIDFVSYIAAGEYAIVLDLAFHVWVVVSLAFGVKYGLLRAKEEKNPPVFEDLPLTESAETDTEHPEEPQTQRTLTLTRQKSFVGCAVAFVCFVNGKEVCQLNNGETKSVTVSGSDLVLGVMLSNSLSSQEIKIGAGSEDISYRIAIKFGMMASKIEITPLDH